ncbi:Mpo1-like protein, partial [Klebsiella pneumoniae]|uniref:Mpo1-like protein n=3 Tax=Pseudomonadota TaxID=1224 RepID=UPI00272F9078
ILAWALSALWYLTRGNLVLGVATTIANGLLTALALPAAQGSTTGWLVIGVGSFVVGWVFQFVGHYYEGRKPAFVDDLVGLLVGPMFVVGEAM